MSDARDDIDDLVDWQLAQGQSRPQVCRVCLVWWTGSSNNCPDCGTEQ